MNQRYNRKTLRWVWEKQNYPLERVTASHRFSLLPIPEKLLPDDCPPMLIVATTTANFLLTSIPLCVPYVRKLRNRASCVQQIRTF